MLLGGAAFGQLPLIVGDTKPDYVRMMQLLEGQVMVVGRGRAYQNPLDMLITIDAIRRLRDAPPPSPAVAMRLLAGLELPTVVDASEAVELVCAKRQAMEREFLSDARGRRHTMVAGTVQHPPRRAAQRRRGCRARGRAGRAGRQVRRRADA